MGVCWNFGEFVIVFRVFLVELASDGWFFYEEREKRADELPITYHVYCFWCGWALSTVLRTQLQYGFDVRAWYINRCRWYRFTGRILIELMIDVAHIVDVLMFWLLCVCCCTLIYRRVELLAVLRNCIDFNYKRSVQWSERNDKRNGELERERQRRQTRREMKIEPTNTPACRKVYERTATCQLALTRQRSTTMQTTTTTTTSNKKKQQQLEGTAKVL